MEVKKETTCSTLAGEAVFAAFSGMSQSASFRTSETPRRVLYFQGMHAKCSILYRLAIFLDDKTKPRNAEDFRSREKRRASDEQVIILGVPYAYHKIVPQRLHALLLFGYWEIFDFQLAASRPHEMNPDRSASPLYGRPTVGKLLCGCQREFGALPRLD